MKLLRYLPILFICLTVHAQSIEQPIKKQTETKIQGFVKKTTIASLSVGFMDEYRSKYVVPSGFNLSNTTGFAPVYGTLEYGISDHVSIGANFYYDAFYSNFYKLYQAYGTEYKRYATDKVRVFSGGAICNYHFGNMIPIKKLDAFVGMGIALNNIHNTGKPQGDSTAIYTEHTVSPSIKAGVRYYLSKSGSLYANIGYDRKTIFSIGFSCRFLHH